MRKYLPTAVAVVLISGLGVPAASGVAAAAPTPAPAAGPGTAVTLVTGDRVELIGDRPEIIPAAGRASMPFRVSRDKGRLRVVPGDAAALIAAGRLDPRLFDVTGLLEQRQDDESRADVPLILQYRDGAPRTAVAGARTVRPLVAVNGESVTVAKKNTPDWWREVTEVGALDKIWLNGQRRLTLDRSAAQIGAPAAWQAGLTGRGVRIAVLDTGIDAAHPDLAGKVATAANFTSEPAGDQYGHGTHVASIAAGGAAAGTRYRGVAPDASLLDAKICDATGTCWEDAILAGMQWAADQKAQVANLSVGGWDSPGLDPMEQAVNTLSEQYGMLFVVAAGNAGPYESTVNSPGSAEAALAVASVDRDDVTARSSSRGPRIGDGGLKPDIAAPGVGIVAARAAGTEIGDVVDDHHVAVSGTSMATPHVAGAAALLLQQHPSWTNEQVKATLMSSARIVDGAGVFDQGAGRADVAAAITQSVTAAPASVAFGIARWPHQDGAVVAKTVTYRNTGSAAVSLDLTLPGSGRVFAVSPSRVVVPAGGAAQVRVTAATGDAQVQPGRHTARLVATGAGMTVSTPMAVEKEDERYDVEITRIGRGGGAPGEYLTWLDQVGGDCGDIAFCGGVTSGSESKSTLRMPPGKYTLADFSTPEGTTGLNVMMQFVVDVSRDTALTVDARRAEPVELTAPHASARMTSRGLTVARDVQRPEGVLFYTVSGDGSTPLYTADLGGEQAGKDNVFSIVTAQFAEPGPAGDFLASPYEYNLAKGVFGELFTGLRLQPRQEDFAAVETQYSASGEGREFRAGHYGQPTSGRPELINYVSGPGPRTAAAPLPLRRREYLLASGLKWTSGMEQGDVETGDFDFVLREVEPQVYQAGRVYGRTWGRGVFGPQFAAPHNLGGYRLVGATTRQGDRLIAAFGHFVDSAPGHGWGVTKQVDGSQRLYRDGRLIEEVPFVGRLEVDLPPEPATYRLEATVEKPGLQVSPRVSTAWTFRSGRVDDGQAVALPLLSVRYTPQLDEYNRARPGAGFRVPVELYRQPTAGTAQIATLAVEFSHDDGGTWHRAPLARSGERWLATVDNPAGGAVSLRVTATDTDGNKIEQTTVRGYRVAD
ncbi:S8 family peptidase [Actinoplanes sp. NPDC051861]|uniref:S8 family peptidase n=1 Tax=Actinoplanes sp. NPDC051861 TaxID=3155170 RepID=UPI003431FC37